MYIFFANLSLVAFQSALLLFLFKFYCVYESHFENALYPVLEVQEYIKLCYYFSSHDATAQ
jgi:hypothetical protein